LALRCGDHREAPATVGTHAVVMGGSIAGLLAARALSDHFDAVTIVERDRLRNAVEARKGVPQGRHVHAFLARGLQAVEQLLPGFTQAIAADGATRVHMGQFYTFLHGAFRARFDTDLHAYCQSRPFVEAHVRRRVTALRNVRVRDECDVVGFGADDRGSISGVRVRPRGPGGVPELLSANLTVDASGRGSRTPEWIAALGYDRPRESTVKIGLGYATRIYARPPEGREWKAIIVFGHPPTSKRHGVVFPLEGERWLITLGGLVNDHPPTDEERFAEFARSLPVPHVHRAIQSAEPVSDIVAHKYPSSARRHFETMRRFPEGLVVVGDALCSFNPIYGQGMTVSALEAVTLDACLRERGERGLGARFMRRAAKLLDDPWMTGKVEDFRFPEIEGERPLWLPFIHKYMDRVIDLAALDEDVALRSYRMMHMLDPPWVVFRPAIMRRVFGSWLPRRSVVRVRD
jgi:2-polyprenyl-6-methoxyphenol hydroxylase-like FAD-dependent oxidoreductase